MKEIWIEYMPSLKNHIEAYARYEKSTARRRIDIMISMVLMLLGVTLCFYSIVVKRFDLYFIFAIAFIVVGAGKLFGFIDLGKTALAIEFKTSNKLKGARRICFSENGIAFEMKGLKSDIEWSFYHDCMESENTILLVYGKGQYSVIPKAAFGDDDLKHFRELLKNKIHGNQPSRDRSLSR